MDTFNINNDNITHTNVSLNSNSNSNLQNKNIVKPQSESSDFGAELLMNDNKKYLKLIY